MIVLGLVLAALAAALHVFIFYLESLAWTTGRARAVFGTSEEEATATRELAFNQGFYNLFLAVVAGIGIVAWAAGSAVVGASLTLAGVGSMAAAALVLFLSSPDKRPAAVKQGTLPLLAVVVLVLAFAL
ncbi:DUF1304 domain-containing protein [Tessaracoccus lacteus]|uniref:DUF1304 domain-containing protein n=1 Tax=Tessaracoccus lacteus TaxID=3041766 RepID=A0ABY8PUN0_9ACTN|nr:DUF1304 domain-containing protein [Tessaracoccus sp. T21]WGT46157.1 DUF1304 domain-containing protein [Tessaracoccus sp. T21]